jgi:TolA-binding protein
MKRIGFISTVVLFLLLGITAQVSAQQDDRDKPPAQAGAQQQDQATPPEEKREDAKPAQDEKQTQQDDKKVQDEGKREQETDKQSQDQDKQQQKDEKRAQQQDDKNNPQGTQDAHRAGGNAGGRIPDDKFRAHFGQQHKFHIGHPTIVSGQPRFQYSGYWFVIANPWPVGWSYSDDCYIDYVDGEYLLFDLAHPGVNIVVNVIL